MWCCLFLFDLFICRCVLTEEKGVNLEQKKDSYFDNCCHNWPIAGQTAVSCDLFWADWRLKHPLECFAFSFFFFAVQCVEIGLLETMKTFLVFKQWTIFFFVDLRIVTEANINSAWQSILPKKRRRHQGCLRMEMIVAIFHKLCLEWFITFYHLKCLHFRGS